jgi:hypothetical protein
MKQYISFFLLFINFGIILPLHSQWVTKITLHRDSTKYTTPAFRAITFGMDTAIIEGAMLIIGKKSFPVFPDEHVQSTNGISKSNLIVFDEPQQSFRIESVNPEHFKQAYLIHTPDITTELRPKIKATDSCTHPPMVMQEVWRSGLPDPNYERIPNSVRHQIIHHSATDNELTDYINLIRSIYLYHTEVNGWSDIGYNYLISPDGILFAGRDPGENLAQDNVLGAHFCASNTGTMGICMLGTFMNQLPTSEALSTLNQLISWKAIASNLDPEGTYSHPLNPDLGTIAGHRDGCATGCPGDSLASILPKIRTHSLETLYGCGVFPGLNALNTSFDLKIFPNPSLNSIINYSTSLNLQKAILFDVLGNQLAVWDNLAEEKTLHLPSNIKDGLYTILFITHAGRVIPQKLLVTEQF